MKLALNREQLDFERTIRDCLDASCGPAERPAPGTRDEGRGGTQRSLVQAGLIDPDLGAIEWTLLARTCGLFATEQPWLSYMRAGLSHSSPYSGARFAFVPAGGVTFQGRPDGTRHVMGIAPDVMDAPGVDGFIIEAPNKYTRELIHVPAHSEVSAPADDLDPRRPVEITFDRAVGDVAEVQPRYGRRSKMAHDQFKVVLAAELVGLAQGAVDIAARHVTDRQQFGRPVGTFQAVSHPLANAFVELELAWSMVLRAAAALAEGHRDRACAVHDSVLMACEASTLAGTQSIQAHGAAGVIANHPVGLRYNRSLYIIERLRSRSFTVRRQLYGVAHAYRAEPHLIPDMEPAVSSEVGGRQR